MKMKIITAVLSGATFLSGFAFTFNLPGAKPTEYTAEASAFTMVAEPSPLPEIYTARAVDGVLTVYDSGGEVVTECLTPYGLPEEELAELESGITLGSREEMLKFLEDFEE